MQVQYHVEDRWRCTIRLCHLLLFLMYCGLLYEINECPFRICIRPVVSFTPKELFNEML